MTATMTPERSGRRPGDDRDGFGPVLHGYFPLAPWAGFGVLCLWAALALCLATVLLRRRDA
jgi:hypothetical protein